ncbi:MAG: LamG-like jellyroll fold domain-containing protein [Candidatus Brocadiia bacterium]
MRAAKGIFTALLVLLAPVTAAAEQYSWQKPHAKVLPTGDLKWAPEPFEFRPGDSVRYIDFGGGDDANDGLTNQTPWKHHPWDRKATGKAAEASGPITYVFKGGAAYRGQLGADESGEPGNPIRLTRDPSWGEGKPWLIGSARLPAEWVRASQLQPPGRLPDPEKVWALDLSETGLLDEDNEIIFTQPARRWNRRAEPPFYGLFLVSDDGTVRKLHLARTPDWQPGGEKFAMDYWHKWDGTASFEDAEGRQVGGPYDEDLKGFPADYFTGGYLWSQYPLFMGTPTPREIPATTKHKKTGEQIPYYYPEHGAFRQGYPGGMKKNVRYMIENLPQCLDSPGEFYLDGGTGILYLRLAEGADPNALRLELSNDYGQITIQDQSHIEISGLRFSFARGATIGVTGTCGHIDIHHCEFYDAAEVAVRAGIKMARKEPRTDFLDHVRVADCEFRDVWETGVRIADGSGGSLMRAFGRLGRVDVLRNRFYNTGFRHAGNVQSNVPTVSVLYPRTAEIAGNIVRRSFGSGIVVFGGKQGALGSLAIRMLNVPFIRILVHHNLTEDTARGVNDYGGLALWQGGPIYAYCNNIGSSVGHMPGGFWGIPMANLSYPLYLDGAYKIYCFNNVIWGGTIEEEDPYRSMNSAYFMVFGFLNQFTNNTVYRHGKGIGGSSGNRCDVLSNVFSEIKRQFLANNRMGDPSLVGGGDDAASGLRGVPSLAFAANVFHGEARAGGILRQRYDDQDQPRLDIPLEIGADSISAMARQMQQFPVRFGQLGTATDSSPVAGCPAPQIGSSAEVDFRPRPTSAAIDAGVTYFIPWSLYGTVGEWHFTENRAAPRRVLDYHWYMSEAHFYRMMYEQVPTFDLEVNRASLQDFVPAPSEDWAKGALRFDGGRFARYPDAALREDFRIPLSRFRGKHRNRIPDEEPFEIVEGKGDEEGYLRYPAERRKTLAIQTENLLVEANLRAAAGHTDGIVLGKHDGRSGYQLTINDAGRAEFRVSSDGSHDSVATAGPVNDGGWHHVLAEIDRRTGRMAIYLDGHLSAQATASLPPEASLDCAADFLVGKGMNDSEYFKGAIDFLRVCRGTLEDAQTEIQELYEWQTNGPFLRDLCGNEPVGRRDAGAIELPK